MAEDAEALVRRRRYGEAVEVYRRAAEGCPHADLVKEFRARAQELKDSAVLFDSLRDQIHKHPERFRSIDLGHGFKANAVDADRDSVTVKVRGPVPISTTHNRHAPYGLNPSS